MSSSLHPGGSKDPVGDSHSTADALPEPIARWIESETGGRIVAAARSGGGASRRAWAVDLSGGEGPHALFCLVDAEAGAGGSLRDAAVLRTLAGTAVPVPRVVAVSEACSALLLERIEGRSDFPAVDDPSEREPTAGDLMRLTARLHALDPVALAIAHLGPPPRDPGQAARDRLGELAALLDALGGDVLPVQRLAADWLVRHPPIARRTSLVHSDMGPGNFLYAGGRVTAIVDWEVAHWGDPMEDLAAIAVRDMATPVGPLERRWAEYEAAGGDPVELDAVAWYRVFILARNTALIALRLRATLEQAARSALERFELLLLRALALCLCDGVGAERPAPGARSASPAPVGSAAFDLREGESRENGSGPGEGADLRARAIALSVDLHARVRAAGDGFAPFADRLPQRLVSTGSAATRPGGPIPIEGLEPSLVVSPADDTLHRPTSADPSWIETVWFPFWIPEAGISVYARIWFRPNAGEQGGAVHAWRGTGEILAYDGWTEAFTDFPDLRSLSLSRGFQLICEAPLSRYRIVHRAAAIEVDVVFEARTAPNPVPPEESPGMFAGHLEQAGRVRGRIRIGERSYEVDCGSIRDRSWGPRTMRSDLRLGNAHGTSRAGDAFFAYVNPDAAGVERVTSGYLLRAGRAARIVAGERHTRWAGSHPASLALTLKDALGRSACYSGEVVNRQALDAGNEIYAVLNLVRWRAAEVARDHAGTAPAGDALWGENHDIWSRAAWLAAGREPLPRRG